MIVIGRRNETISVAVTKQAPISNRRLSLVTLVA
jgi:hypothetical protein